MSIVKIINDSIQEITEGYKEYIEGLSSDCISGSMFMIYALEAIYKDEDFEDIEAGIIDSAYRKENHDYGIDAIYIRNNKTFIEDTEQLQSCNQDSIFKIQIFQFKRGTGIDQGSILKLKEGICKILINENSDEGKNKYLFDRMVSLNEIKNEIYKNFPTKNIIVEIFICFSGNENTVLSDELITTQFNDIKNQLSENGYNNIELIIVDGKNLIEKKKKGNDIIDVITYEKSFKYITESEGSSKLNGYISIVNGKEIARLVKSYRAGLFEANIRDYYRRSDLNSKILDTCSDENESKFFWSFNNGLTITCNQVEDLPNNKYRLHGIQIVNGCQTSNSLYQALYNEERANYLKTKKENEGLNKKELTELEKIDNKYLNENTSVLTKIIETNDNDLIYRITETTNSQTPIKTFSLKANDNIQILIEEYLSNYGIYYERRVNYYRNQGKRNLVSIQRLFQLYLSYFEIIPSQIKTRPKSFLDSHYDKVFNISTKKTSNRFDLYKVAIMVDHAINKRIRYIQRNKLENDAYNLNLLSYGKFHLGCFVLKDLVGNRYNEKGIALKTGEIEGIVTNDEKFAPVFSRALNSFKKVAQSVAGARKESIREALRRKKIDDAITKLMKKE